MSSPLQTYGTYRGVVAETSVNTTKNGYPQWVPRLQATQKFVELPEELQFFHDQGALPDAKTPAWVDWSAYDESILGYLVLFGGKNTAQFVTEGPEKNTTANYDQLKVATGWDGLSFDSLNDETLIGKEILFRVEANEWDGKVTPKVTWIDSKDASPTRELRRLDSTALANLNAKLVAAKPRPKPASAPAPAPARTVPAQGAVAAPKTASAAKPQPVATPVAPVTPGKARPRLPAAKAPAPVPAPVHEPQDDLAALDAATASDGEVPATMTQEAAWAWVNTHKGDTDDGAIKETWIAAISEISEAGGNKAEEAFTTTEWARVAKIVREDCGLS